MTTAMNRSGAMASKLPASRGRVLFLAQLPPPVHGVTTISAHVLKTLERAGAYEVEHLWTGSARAIEDVGRKSLGKILGFAGLIGRLAWRAITGQRYDVTYQTLAPHGDAALRDALIIAAGKLLARRRLVHLHTRGLDELLSAPTWRGRFLRWVLRSTELVAVSSEVADTARAWGGFSAVHDLPNFVAGPETVTPTPGARLRCGYLGNYDPRKGILRFVEIFAALKHAGIDVEGFAAGGPTRHLNEADVRDYANRLGVGDELEVLGFADAAEKHRRLGATDVFIYPTEHDLAPLVVIEAMAHGAVPVVFDTGALRELVGPEFASHVIVPNRDRAAYCADVVAIVETLCADPERLMAARKAARDRYDARFTPARFEDTLLNVFAGATVEPREPVVDKRQRTAPARAASA
ncbi:MAG: glycosyltransferase family 4 protein [Hyphomicrobiaceae bacterium]|nr:glycosyltransferase family 4 protein [Hyphomicrobiaceae bacterium]